MFSRLAPPERSRTPSRKRSLSFSGTMGASFPPVQDASPRTASFKPGHRSGHGSGSVMVPANIASADPRIHASSSSRIHFPESRPSPVHRATWSSTPFVPNLKIHKTIALSPGQPSLVYNIIFKPSHQNILNGSTMTPISAHTLALSATLPRVTELTLTCRELMWPIVVTSTANPQHAITNLDVIEAVHAQLNVPATRREWEALGHNSKPQARVADAYNRRCAQTRDWDNGVRRVDWLQGRTVLVGIESTPNGHELVFSK